MAMPQRNSGKGYQWHIEEKKLKEVSGVGRDIYEKGENEEEAKSYWLWA